MARSQESFNKKEKEKKRLKKRKDKEKKREERKSGAKGNNFEDMIAYVDENGNITDTPPDLSNQEEIDPETIEVSTPKKEDIDTLRTGRVEFFNESKGFGFIKDSESRDKYFVHANGLLEPIKDNDKVCFELERGLKGMNAVQVKKI